LPVAQTYLYVKGIEKTHVVSIEATIAEEPPVNTDPTVAIEVLAGSNSILVKATTENADNVVFRLKSGGVLEINNDKSAPYGAQWSVPAGTYTVDAEARREGVTYRSGWTAPVTVTVE
jgi:hypothetical protein